MKAITVSLVSLLSLAACATDADDRQPTTSRQNAQAVLDTASAALERASKASNPSLTASVHIVESCGASGTISLDGSYNGTDDRLIGTWDVLAKFDACGSSDGTLDGTVRWQSTHDNSDFTASLVGNLDWSSGGLAGSCAFDLHTEIRGGIASYRGTVCGYDIDELDVDLDVDL